LPLVKSHEFVGDGCFDKRLIQLADQLIWYPGAQRRGPHALNDFRLSPFVANLFAARLYSGGGLDEAKSCGEKPYDLIVYGVDAASYLGHRPTLFGLDHELGTTNRVIMFKTNAAIGVDCFSLEEAS
jgi:hypothetical protein